MEFLRKIGSYFLFFRRQATPKGQSHNLNLRTMHTINKVSIFVFLLAIILAVVVKVVG